jgi:hypothetical protein
MLIQECEIKEGTKWKKISIEQGLARRGEPMRCHECHGPVVPMKQYSTGAKAHFEHNQAHDGCPTKEQTYCGTPSPHPHALE